MRRLGFAIISVAAFVASLNLIDDQYTSELAEVTADLQFAEEAYWLESARTDSADSDTSTGYIVRSRHFVFGMPRLIDDRHNVNGLPGVSILVREGFVIGHFDRMGCPLWVCQRWTADELADKANIPSLDRDWKEDPDLPFDLHIGTSYAGNDTMLDRGHMAKHSMNRAWGYDGSIYGCLMSNSAPQHRAINRTGGAWWDLEEAVENVVSDPDIGIDMIWMISGTIFRDKENPVGETPEDDFAAVGRITGGFGVPDATFKIVCWFEDNGFFHARGFVFEQPYTVDSAGKVHFTIPDQDAPLTDFIVPIDEIEERTGLDFFPMLKDGIENLIEADEPADLWGTP